MKLILTAFLLLASGLASSLAFGHDVTGIRPATNDFEQRQRALNLLEVQARDRGIAARVAGDYQRLHVRATQLKSAILKFAAFHGGLKRPGNCEARSVECVMRNMTYFCDNTDEFHDVPFDSIDQLAQTFVLKCMFTLTDDLACAAEASSNDVECIDSRLVKTKLKLEVAP